MKFLAQSLACSAASLALAFSTLAYAHPHQAMPAPAATVAEEPAKPQGPALWKVADDDTTIYLFGTIHLLPKEVDWYSGEVAAALDSSGTLVTEIDMTPELLATIPGMMAEKGMLPEGTTLRSLLTAEQKGKYEATLAKLGIPAEALDPFEPWFAGIQLGQIALMSSGFSSEFGVEDVLERTVKPGTKRAALETFEFQINAFDSLPHESQIAFLMGGTEDIAAAIATLNVLVKEWAKGDHEVIGEIMNEAFGVDPALANALLYNRNANWAEWIDTRLDTPGTVFMAVGAGHLAGEKSVQDLLATRGITTTRVQ